MRVKKHFKLLTFITIMSVISVAYSDENIVYSPTLQNANQANPLKNAPYDEKVFNLAYESFVYSGSVNDAYDLVLTALKSHPDSDIWHERLAQTAVWTSHVKVALEQYTYLIIKRNKTNLLPAAIQYANNMRRYDLLIPLLEYQYQRSPNNVQVIKSLGRAYEQNGDPDQAISFLQKEYKKNPNSEYLSEITRIQNLSGNYKAEYHYITLMEKKHGVTPNTVLAKAKLDVNQGHPDVALSHFKELAHKENITNPLFWQTQGYLAWLLDDEPLARESYLKLYSLRAINEEGFTRLLLLQPKNATRETLKYALASWKMYQNTDAYLLSINLTLTLRDWNKLIQLYQEPIPPEKKAIIEIQPDYSYGQAELLSHFGYHRGARELLLKTVLTHPNVETLEQNYLNFLNSQLSVFITEQEPEYLFSALRYWQSKASSSQTWAIPYMSGLLMLDRPRKALEVLNNASLATIASSPWINRYADVYSALYYDKTAFELRRNNWLLVQKDIGSHPFDDYIFWEPFGELASYFAPMEVGYGLASYLAVHNSTESGAQLLLTWAINHNAYELTQYIVNYYSPDGVPPWALTWLALQTNNQQRMGAMLATMEEALPRRDKVIGAQMISARPLAQTLAYKGLTHIDDPDLYKEFTEIMLQTANEVGIATEFEQFGTIQGIRERSYGKVFLSDKWNLTGEVTNWNAQTNKPELLPDNSYLERIISLKLGRETLRDTQYIEIAQHKDLYNSIMASYDFTYEITSKLKLGGGLGYNKRSTLNAPMLLAGSQDDASVNASYDITPRDNIIGMFEFDNYHLQDRTSLGNGKIYEGEFRHKFWLDYPDYTIRVVGSYNRFNHFNHTIDGRALELLSPGDIANSDFFLTENFWQTGIFFNFGDQIRDYYTHPWRPYASLGLLYDSVSGRGDAIDVGVAGMVFGRDKLKFYFTRTTNSQGTSQKNFILGSSYQMYF